MLDWRSFWIGFLVACSIFVFGFMFYEAGYEKGQKHNRLVRPSAAPVQWTVEDELFFEHPRLDLEDPRFVLPPMPMPRFTPPIYLYNQSPCP